jgi:hypothetical protein
MLVDHIDYYWVDGDDCTAQTFTDRQVTYTIYYGNKSYIAPTTFIVKRPKVTGMQTTTNDIGFKLIYNELFEEDFWHIQFGDDGPGITFTPSVTKPTEDPNGSLNWLQIIEDAYRAHKWGSGTWEHLEATGVLDTDYPYGFLETPPATSDSPAELLESIFHTDYEKGVAADSFSMYLIYKPSEAGSIYVPLWKIPWQWGAQATRTDYHTWHLDTDPTAHTAGANPAGTNCTTYPYWSSNIQDYDYEPGE